MAQIFCHVLERKFLRTQAGHIIALKAMGGFIDSAIIQQVHKKSMWQPYEAWIGFTDVDQRYGVAVGPDEDVRQLKLITIKTLAGIVAEAELADRIIPSSSIDETALATLYSVWIGQQSGQSSQCVLEELDRRTRNLLRANKPIAQAIAQKLHDQCSLSKVELDEMLINVAPWPIHDLGTLQHEEMQPDVAV